METQKWDIEILNLGFWEPSELGWETPHSKGGMRREGGLEASSESLHPSGLLTLPF